MPKASAALRQRQLQRRNLSPRQKAEAVEKSFGRKVELLEAWARSNVPAGHFFPRKIRELESWHDDKLGVTAWMSPNIVSRTGRYRHLRERFDVAVKALTDKQSTSASGLLVRAKVEIDRLGALVRTLSEQNFRLISEKEDLNRLLEIEKAQKASARSRLSELQAGPVSLQRIRLRDVSEKPSDD